MGFLALTFLLLHKLYQQPVLAHQIMPFFLVLGLAGVPAALFFSFLALLEFQQPYFFIFQPCWSSSSLTLSSSVAFTATQRGRGVRRPFRAAQRDYFLGLAGKRNVS